MHTRLIFLKKTRVIVLTLVLIIAALVAAELLARSRRVDYPEIYGFTHQQPPPLAFGSYFTPKYLDEMWADERAWPQTLEGLPGTKSFKGQWISLQHGIRTTTDQPVMASWKSRL